MIAATVQLRQISRDDLRLMGEDLGAARIDEHLDPPGTADELRHDDRTCSRPSSKLDSVRHRLFIDA